MIRGSYVGRPVHTRSYVVWAETLFLIPVRVWFMSLLFACILVIANIMLFHRSYVVCFSSCLRRVYVVLAVMFSCVCTVPLSASETVTLEQLTSFGRRMYDPSDPMVMMIGNLVYIEFDKDMKISEDDVTWALENLESQQDERGRDSISSYLNSEHLDLWDKALVQFYNNEHERAIESARLCIEAVNSLKASNRDYDSIYLYQAIGLDVQALMYVLQGISAKVLGDENVACSLFTRGADLGLGKNQYIKILADCFAGSQEIAIGASHLTSEIYENMHLNIARRYIDRAVSVVGRYESRLEWAIYKKAILLYMNQSCNYAQDRERSCKKMYDYMNKLFRKVELAGRNTIGARMFRVSSGYPLCVSFECKDKSKVLMVIKNDIDVMIGGCDLLDDNLKYIAISTLGTIRGLYDKPDYLRILNENESRAQEVHDMLISSELDVSEPLALGVAAYWIELAELRADSSVDVLFAKARSLIEAHISKLSSETHGKNYYYARYVSVECLVRESIMCAPGPRKLQLAESAILESGPLLEFYNEKDYPTFRMVVMAQLGNALREKAMCVEGDERIALLHQSLDCLLAAESYFITIPYAKISMQEHEEDIRKTHDEITKFESSSL